MIRRAGIFVLATAAFGAAATDPIAAILDQARGTPAEIFADVAFHLIDGNRIAEKDRAALLEEVFWRADGAVEPMASRPAEIPPPLLRTRGSGLHLDALSIKCRAVKALLTVDGKRARARFSEIATPRISKPDCTISVLSDPTVYFETLAEVATKAPFTAEEQQKQVSFWMMADAVSGIQTSPEIIAAARNFSYLVHNEKEALAMSAAFATALGIDDCNRNFTAAVSRTNLVDAVLITGGRFAALGASPQTIQTALRGYLVRHLTAPRCEDSLDQQYTDSLALFNSSASRQAAVPPISEDEVKPAKVEGKAERETRHDPHDFVELANEVNALTGLPTMVSNVRPFNVDAINAKELDPSEGQRVLAKLGAWKGSDGEDPIDVFHDKADLYFTLLRRSTPPLRTTGSFRADVLSGLIATLEDTATLNASPCDWLVEVHTLDRASIYTSLSADGKNDVYMNQIPPGNVEAMINSSLSALSMYGRLGELEHPTRPIPVPHPPTAPKK